MILIWRRCIINNKPICLLFTKLHMKTFKEIIWMHISPINENYNVLTFYNLLYITKKKVVFRSSCFNLSIKSKNFDNKLKL